MTSWLRGFLALPVSVVAIETAQLPEDMPYNLYLDSAEKFRLFWKYDQDTITFQVKTAFHV